MLLWVDMAWVHHLSGEVDEAVAIQTKVVERLQRVLAGEGSGPGGAA